MSALGRRESLAQTLKCDNILDLIFLMEKEHINASYS